MLCVPLLTTAVRVAEVCSAGSGMKRKQVFLKQPPKKAAFRVPGRQHAERAVISQTLSRL